MAIEIHEYTGCADCYLLAGTGDASSLDYHYGDGADARLAEILAGMDRLVAAHPGGSLTAGDSGGVDEFSSASCDCCGTSLAGMRGPLLVLATPAATQAQDRVSSDTAGVTPCPAAGCEHRAGPYRNAAGIPTCAIHTGCETQDRVPSDTAPGAPTTETP